jgi:hypothetical protein
MKSNYQFVAVRTMKDWDKILVHVIVSLSFGISLLGCSRYIILEMADYSFALENKFVPTLYLSTSSAEYYDWEDAIEDFLWDRGLESHMKIFFARRTFSISVLQWWIKLQQGLINRGKDPCRTWKGMKVMLQRRFDPPLKAKKIAIVDGTKFLDSKQIVRSAWTDSIVGNECLNVTSQQFATIKYCNKKKVVEGADQNKNSMNAANFHHLSSVRRSHLLLLLLKYFLLAKMVRIIILLLLLR